VYEEEKGVTLRIRPEQRQGHSVRVHHARHNVPRFVLRSADACNDPLILDATRSTATRHLRNFSFSFNPKSQRQKGKTRSSAHTERHRLVVETPASYSRGPGFTSQPEDRVSCLSFSWFSSVHPGKFRDSTSNYATTISSHILSD
jgi:hypothetical protein